MSKILESAILEKLGAEHVWVEDDFAYVAMDDHSPLERYRLSPEAKRIALLEAEGRPLDIQPGGLTLLVP